MCLGAALAAKPAALRGLAFVNANAWKQLKGVRRHGKANVSPFVWASLLANATVLAHSNHTNATYTGTPLFSASSAVHRPLK